MSLPLDVIDKRLKDFRIFCHGERSKTMLPQRSATPCQCRASVFLPDSP
jgi:hypothetical protein